MKRTLIAALVGVLLTPWICEAQYYPYYYGYGYAYPQAYQAPQPYYSPSTPQARVPASPFYKRWSPDPRMIRKWEQHNRMSDFDQLQRSPLNPESSLEYMLRTF